MLSEYERRVIVELEQQLSSEPAEPAAGLDQTALTDPGAATRRPVGVLVPLVGALLVVTGVLFGGFAVTLAT